MQSPSMTDTHAAFLTTNWELVAMVAGGDGSACDGPARAALDELARRYWPAAYAYLRRSGKSRDDAADITQGFFADVVLWRGLFQRAEHQPGRLRSLVLAALANYMVDCHRRNGHVSRTCVDASSLDTIDAAARGTSEPGSAFDRQWAAVCLDEATNRCRAHFVSVGKHAHWALFEAREILPVVSQQEKVPLEELARSLGFESAAQAAAAVQTVKRSFLTMLAESCGAEVDGEGSENVVDRLRDMFAT